ncbi:MAG: FAD-binding oxidoreductase [Gammaproteobacteria bacterium]
MTTKFDGHVFHRGEHGYEEARRGSVWCAGVADRYPEMIIQAKNENDVIAAVKLANEKGLRLSVRSGGHSWPNNHLREGCLMLDINQLNDYSIDPKSMTATAQPGLHGSDLNKVLSTYELYFPTGHCTSVSIGGYLLQGGFGWNGRVYGPACMSVIGIDAVTADGKLIHADEHENADLLWAARGAGPGFFAVVTRYYIKVYPRHRITMNSTYVYPLDVFEEVFRWSHEIGRETTCEINTLVSRSEAANNQPVITLLATAFGDSEVHCREMLALYETCPVRDRAMVANVYQRSSLSQNTQVGSEGHYWPRMRYVADNIWTHAKFDDLIPGLRKIVDTLPPAPTHMVWFNWGSTNTVKRPDMAFSLEDDFYYAVYAAWSDPEDDDKYKRWVTERMRELEPFSSGIQLADENLINRPARFMKDENLKRLDELRSKYDPNNLFYPWLGRPW